MSKIYIEPASSERDHRRLEALGQKLGIPIPMAFLEMEVTLPNGTVTHHHKQRAHSWTRNAYNLLLAEMGAVNGAGGAVFGGGFINAKDTAASVKTGEYGMASGYRANTFPSQDMRTAGYGAIAAAADNTMGIQVGSGINAESFEDFALQTPIANGSGAGQLAYAWSEAYVISYVAGTKTLTVTHVRYMNNNSAGDVSVNEVALIVKTRTGVSEANGTLLVHSRDHLGATVTIPATGQLKVTYTISLVYPF